jgi:hypothetical protein
MRKLHSAAAICALLLGAMAVVAAAQANINTSRSNIKGSVAAPADEAVPTEGTGEEQRVGRKGYDHYQARSDMASAAAGTVGSGEPIDGDSLATTTVPKQTQGATFGERVNAGALGQHCALAGKAGQRQPCQGLAVKQQLAPRRGEILVIPPGAPFWVAAREGGAEGATLPPVLGRIDAESPAILRHPTDQFAEVHRALPSPVPSPGPAGARNGHRGSGKQHRQ